MFVKDRLKLDWIQGHANTSSPSLADASLSSLKLVVVVIGSQELHILSAYLREEGGPASVFWQQKD